MFDDYPEASTIVFEDVVDIRVQIQSTTPGVMVVLMTAQGQDLSIILPQLWAKGPHDVCLINSAEPVRITVRDWAIQPRVHQYPLSMEAEEGTAPTIQALIDQGILYLMGHKSLAYYSGQLDPHHAGTLSM